MLFSEMFPEGFILKNLTEGLGFEKPTPIQQHTIPAIFEGRDVYAGARTGSGKTFAFIAPLAQMIVEGKIQKALVLCPTRELALQIDEEAMKIFEGQTDFCSCPLYGGVPLDQQLRAIQIHKPQLFLATPGRMIDFIQEGCLPLSEIEAVVLDEADRMCDMGFSDQVEEILQTVPYRKQTLMFSATLPKRANVIMEKYLNDPIKVQLDDPLKSSSTITHKAVFVNARDRIGKLKEYIEEPNQTIVIFTRTRREADSLFSKLKKDYDKIGILHAGYTMGERERTIRAFKEEKIQFLIATDVAARGLDIERITKVIHYDLPDSPDDYIHRSGRSGRAGRDGVTIALIDNRNFNQRRMLQELSKQINFETTEDAPQEGGERKGRAPRRDKREGSRDEDKPRDSTRDSKRSSRQRSDRSPSDRKDSKPRGPRKRSDSSKSDRPSKASSPQKAQASTFFKKAQKLIGGIFGKPAKEEKPETETPPSKSSDRPRREGSRRPSNRRRGPRKDGGSGPRSGGNRSRSGRNNRSNNRGPSKKSD